MAMLLLSTWALPTALVQLAGAVTSGQVTAKAEFIRMPGGERWRHVYDVTFQFRPQGSPRPEVAHHTVDAWVFDRLHVGSVVQVRYATWTPVRMIADIGSTIDGTSAWTRRPWDSGTVPESLELAAVVMAIGLGIAAWRQPRKQLVLVAATVGASVAFAVVPFGSVGVLVLVALWRRRRSSGFAWAALASTALGTAGLVARVPWPSVPPAAPRRTGVATVRRVSNVTAIWVSDEASQRLRLPYQMVDLEFTPDSRSGSVHALDRVDSGSVAGLRDGALVPIVYATSEPRQARIQSGRRSYGRDALLYVLQLNALVLAGLVAIAFAVSLVGRALGGVLFALKRRVPLTHAFGRDWRQGLTDEQRRRLEEIIQRAERPKSPAD
ncbi:MAG: hypothetical protein U0132_13385 [Gemmatimonadaceae bacterium]